MRKETDNCWGSACALYITPPCIVMAFGLVGTSNCYAFSYSINTNSPHPDYSSNVTRSVGSLRRLRGNLSHNPRVKETTRTKPSRAAISPVVRVFNKQTFLQTFERLFEAWQTNSNRGSYKQIQTERPVCLVCLKQWYRWIFWCYRCKWTVQIMTLTLTLKLREQPLANQRAFSPHARDPETSETSAVRQFS